MLKGLHLVSKLEISMLVKQHCCLSILWCVDSDFYTIKTIIKLRIIKLNNFIIHMRLSSGLSIIVIKINEQRQLLLSVPWQTQ